MKKFFHSYFIKTCATRPGLPDPSDRIKPKERIKEPKKAEQFYQLENIFSSENHGVL